MTTWKATERRIAKRLSGQRVPVADKRSGADVISDTLSVEVKHRKQLPAWLHKAMAQAVNAATGEQTPIVVLHELGKRGDNDYVIIRMRDFAQFEKDGNK